MTEHKSFKRLVRARMEKTGERYAAARAALLAADGPPTASEGPALPMSDDTIRGRTGRGWEAWFDVLDAWGAADRTQPEASDWVAAEHGLDRWSSQAVSITYHRARGLRAVGEKDDGFAVGATKTVAVPVERLFDAFVDPAQRERWLPGAALRERTARRPRSARFDWEDGATRVYVDFVDKGGGRSLAAGPHVRLPDGESAERMKAFWRERITALKVDLET